MEPIAIGAVVTVAAVVLVLARRKPSTPTRRQASQPRQRARTAPTEAPAALALKPGHAACEAAQRLTGRRFPPDDAPNLPLPTCDNKACSCAFDPIADQRRGGDGTDRRLGVGLQSELYLTTGNRDRRRARGRRKTDRPR